MSTTSNPSILLLTTQSPSEIRAEWPYYQNWTLPGTLRERGAKVSIKCWRDEALDAQALARYDIICFLWCNNYHEHPIEFPAFIEQRLLPAQKLRPTLRILNDANLVLWNTDKAHYLVDLERAGFLIPKVAALKDCTAISTVEDLAAQIRILGAGITDGPIVLKPSISGSSKQTHLLQNPSTLSPADTTFLSSLLKNGIDGDLLLQAYEPSISNGEYSLVFIAGTHTHTMLKTPAHGEFRCQAEFGGGITELAPSQVPAKAIEVAEKIMRYLNENVGMATYCRVDGVIGTDGEFVLMEVEGIEPHLWLETCQDKTAREMLYNAILGKNEVASLMWT